VFTRKYFGIAYHDGLN